MAATLSMLGVSMAGSRAAVSRSAVGIPVVQEVAQTRSMPIGPDGGGVRIAELVATLSYAADLGLGQLMEHCLGQTVIALWLADLVEADAEDREATYYLGLLSNAYCHADASEQARWFGDDISFKADGYEGLAMNTVQMAALLLRRSDRMARRRIGFADWRLFPAPDSARSSPG
jgi:hypothetical protein